MTDIELLCHVTRKLEKRHGHFVIQVPFTELFVVLGQLRLALKHPENTGQPAKITRRLLNDTIRALEIEAPEIGPLLRREFAPPT